MIREGRFASSACGKARSRTHWAGQSAGFRSIITLEVAKRVESSSRWRGILVVAALETELAEVKRRDNPGLSLLSTGEGRRNCEIALGRRLEEEEPRLVIGIGLAGALSAELEIGDLVLVERLAGLASQPPRTPLIAAEALTIGGLKKGVAVTADEIVTLAADKRRLARGLQATDVGIVDMESAALAQLCEERRVPYLIVRGISDRFEEDLPLDFNSCRTRNGRISRIKVIMSAIARPKAVRGLLELDRRSKLCARRLADFVDQFLGKQAG